MKSKGAYQTRQIDCHLVADIHSPQTTHVYLGKTITPCTHVYTFTGVQIYKMYTCENRNPLGNDNKGGKAVTSSFA